MNDWQDALNDDIRPLVRKLGKPPQDWRREDLVDYCIREGIKVVNFRYPALDGKLKELRLPVNNRAYLERILAAGERVDGSSLFPGLFEASESDLYVLPVYHWAFINPWSDDELDIVCRFADRDGRPCADTPDNILAAAARRFNERTGAELNALAELEFYIFTNPEHDRFTSRVQRNYHQTAPYLCSRHISDEIIRVASMVTGHVKYCHSETGYMDRIESDETEIDGTRVEQYELEFGLMPIEDLGCWLTVARWLIRVIADRFGASVTFLPKLDEGMAGNGMHLHLSINRDGRNVMCTENGELSDEALQLVGGLLDRAVPLTAFGNTVAASYLRLVPGQEAPTSICWGYHNRASLVRVPLNFANRPRLDQVMNPGETGAYPENLPRPTVEYRGPDGSAFGHLLLAAVTICAEEGVSSPQSAERARALEVTPDRPSGHASFEQLPSTAVAAARALSDQRAYFEERGFTPRLIDIVVNKLSDESDVGLSEKLRALPAAERLAASRRLMHKDLHKH
jgi:glutamine synthetase